MNTKNIMIGFIPLQNLVLVQYFQYNSYINYYTIVVRLL